MSLSLILGLLIGVLIGYVLLTRKRKHLKQITTESNEATNKYTIVTLKYEARLNDLFRCYINQCRGQTQIPLELSNKIFYVIVEMKLLSYGKAYVTVPTIYGNLFNEGIVDNFNLVLNQKIKYKASDYDMAFNKFQILPGYEHVDLIDLSDIVLNALAEPYIKIHVPSKTSSIALA